MTPYSNEQGYKFLSFAKKIIRNIGKNVSKNVNSNTVRTFLIMLNNLQKKHLKLLQKK